ncbi:DUF2268 domain-containing protein [Sporosarcina sp. JAI121]|uniref:DUF2268 domain-containing protein n=1 Tax=Sporosarcina sp. JAI121 TaxID=2723064 RepID=UPI0017B0F8AA|nr:uncharacterized protein YjaZ [Sporosarcina sp. JAI121]
MKLFPGISPEELQYELLNYGLFNPIEWTDIENQVETMETQHIWQIVEREYQLLKELWQGPEVPIYIFPLTQMNPGKSKQIPTKNGVAYKVGLFIFLSEGLPVGEIKALLAHEYNHICRLNYLGLETYKISLKDSLIIEGFGEFAVKELYGEKWLAPWTNLYSFKDSIKVWNKYFIPKLNLIGSENHQIYLYGKARGHLPKWIGYYIGYQIVDSYQKKHGPFNEYELYQKTSDELIAGSDFPVNRSF